MSHSSSSSACNHVCIAQSGVGDVAICPDCGVVHVNLHYFSMRFEVNTFRMVMQMLVQAQARMEATAHDFATASDSAPREGADGSPQQVEQLH